MSTHPVVTTHAARRWTQRVRLGTRRQAHDLVRLAHEGSVLVPYRLAAPRWAARDGRRPPKRQRSRTRFQVSASAVLVCRGRSVVTVIALSVEELAGVMVWLVMGEWT